MKINVIMVGSRGRITLPYNIRKSIPVSEKLVWFKKGNKIIIEKSSELSKKLEWSF